MIRLLLRFVLPVIFITLHTIPLQGQQNYTVVKGERPPIDLKKVPADAYEHDRILIKFKPDQSKALEKARESPGKSYIGILGIPMVDSLNVQYNVKVSNRFFHQNVLGNIYAERHKAWGFHLWYELVADSDDLDVKEMVARYQALDIIELAEPVYKKQLITPVNPEPFVSASDNKSNDKGTDWTPNDPRFAEQWHYHNTGQQSGTIDKDIDLPEAWEIEKGNSDVIVAIIDDGIQYNHPDIAANMWSGIGYNFVNNSSNVIPGNHGTHVAGTVSAVSNNGIGVSGVAGGSGNGDGVRLMSCQVFTASSAGGFHIAPVWAADNGASISQNSWGYIDVGVYNQSELDAIDYFNVNGGGTALTGGITIFAAGNDGTSGQWYPGCYSGAFSVAATNNQDQKSWYSNYDTWIDISAPGGETNTVNARGVLSTITGSTYAYYQGTSMACPHASGVAALIVSLAYGVLTQADVADILKTTTDNHYAQNPSYNGKLGTGRLNAHQALLETQSFVSGVQNPRNFTANPLSTSSIEVNWTKNNDNHDVMLVWAPTSAFGTPVNGILYTAGQEIPGGGTVLFRGSATQFVHTNLSANTQYFYRAFSFNSTNEYSTGREASVYTLCEKVSSLPFTQDFNGSTLIPNCWTTISLNDNNQVWQVGVIASGLIGTSGNYAFLNSDAYGSGNTQNTDLRTPVLDLSIYSSITLSFKHYYRHYSGSTAKFSYSLDGGTSWVDVQSWVANSANPASFNQIITAAAGQNNVMFRWNYSGTYGYYWCIDDVSITGEMNIPGAPTAAHSPTPANNALQIPLNGSLNWTWGNNTDTYDLWFGPHGNMQKIVNGGAAGNAGTIGSYSFSGLNSNSQYQWQVTSYNTGLGLNVSSPQWQFTTSCDTYTLPFIESFEDASGSRPCWTQEYVTGTNNWTYTAGSSGGTITTARSGVKNARFTSTSGGPFITKLISPIIDLSEFMNVRLSFWYGQEFWSPDQNQLKLYYRTSPTAPWVQIGNSYSSNVSQWTQIENIILPNTSSTYQIAFEGIDNWGRANVIDDVEINAEASGPFADFIATPLTAFVNEEITFTDTSGNGDFNSWEWNFGEGAEPATANGQGPHQVTYSNVGGKTISLLVDGTYTKIKTDYVTISENPFAPPRNLQGSLVNNSDILLNWNSPAIQDGFELYENFSLDFGSFSMHDGDGSATYGFEGISFPNSGYTGSFIIFNHNETTPPMVSPEISPFSGDKFAACFAATNPPNNDWLISPKIRLASNETLRFFAKSFVDTYGLERLKVGISTTGTNPADFAIVSSGSYISVPTAWTEYVYDLSAYAGQEIFVGINCVSDDAFILMLDDLSIGSISLNHAFTNASGKDLSHNLSEENKKALDEDGVVNAHIASPKLFSNYRIYKNSFEIGTTNDFHFTDDNPGFGTHTYTVKAVYVNPDGLSGASNEFSITISEINCPPPALLFASEVSQNSANLNWVNGGAEIQWQILWGNSGFNPETEGNLIQEVSSMPFGLHNLLPETDYQFYVRSVCAASSYSVWSAPAEFSTLGLLPEIFVLTGGGSYCENYQPTGVDAQLSGSQTGVSYQLLNNGSAVGSPIAGTNGIISWSNLTAGSYTVEATNASGTVMMNGFAEVIEIPSQLALVTISESNNNICQGISVTFTAFPENGGASPSYQWKVNGQNAGTNNSVFTYVPNNNDQIQVLMTSSLACVTGNPATSNVIAMTVNASLQAVVSISASQNSVCQGTSVTFTAFPENGGAMPSYQWKVNGQNAGTNNNAFTYVPNNNDQIQVVMTSSLECVTGNPAISNGVAMTVSTSLPAGVSISATQSSVCQGTSVTFTAFPENGGATPAYQWKVNGQNTGTNNSTFTFIPNNNDQIQVVMTSSLACVTGNPAISNGIAMTVSTSLPAGVSISATQSSVCQGTSVTFTAFPENGGATPAYQWKVNGQNTGTNNSVFTYVPNNNDQIQVLMTSSLACLTGNPATSNVIAMTVNPVVLSVTANPSAAGTASYSGTPIFGQSVLLTAEAEDGWFFVNWTNNLNEVLSTNTSFSLNVSSCNPIIKANFSAGNTLTGKLAYFNNVETQIPTPYINGAFYAQIFDNMIPVSSPQQIVTGIPYSFSGMETGKSYTMRIWEETTNNLIGQTWAWNNWGGVTALDALIVSYMVVENPVLSAFPWIRPAGESDYTPFFSQVADANNSTSITSLDALILLYRSVDDPLTIPFPGGRHNFQIAGKKMTTLNEMAYPAAPDMIFIPNGIYTAASQATSVFYEAQLPLMETGTNNFNIYLVATGDLNASYYLVSPAKSHSALSFEGVIAASVGDEILIPVRINQQAELGAITIGMSYNKQLIDVVDVIGYEIFNINKAAGEVHIAWFDQNGRSIGQNQEVVVLKAKVIAEINQGVRFAELLSTTEFANVTASVLQGISLSTSYVETSVTAVGDLNALSLDHSIFPNPFNDVTNIHYTLPATGKVSVVVYNHLGQEVKALFNGTQIAGAHTLRLNNYDLNGSGTYFYRIMLEGETKTLSARGTIMLAK